MSERIVGVIGGTGLYELEGVEGLEEVRAETPFGPPSDAILRGRMGDVFDRSIDVLISRLRRKLGERSSTQLFKTVRNGGYQFAARVDLQDNAT